MTTPGDTLDHVGHRVAPGWALVAHADPLSVATGVDVAAMVARSWVSPDVPMVVVSPDADQPQPRPTLWPVGVPVAELAGVLEHHDPWWSDLAGVVVAYLPPAPGLPPRLTGTPPGDPWQLGWAMAGWLELPADSTRDELEPPPGLVSALVTLVYCATSPGDVGDVADAARLAGVRVVTTQPPGVLELDS